MRSLRVVEIADMVVLLENFQSVVINYASLGRIFGEAINLEDS